jgi:flagellin
MIINHNMSSINANNVLKYKSAEVTRDMEKLSSGQKINRAGDDASGLAVSEKMRSQIRGLQQAEKNIQNGVSFIQATEGYLSETTDIVQRMRELAVQSANGIYSPEDRMQIQVEVSQLINEVDRIASHAQFNGMNMLTGKFANAQLGGTPTNSMWFMVGANMDQRKQMFIGEMTSKALKFEGMALTSPDSSNKAIGTLDDAMKAISKQRADLGAYQNRFETAQKGISIAAENLTAAESIVRDTDMAGQMVQFVKNNILNQAGTAMLAQANTQTQSVLRLLG